MASYHRILKVFGRSVEDKTLQCDCDIHPWEIQVNGDRWSGRLRLIGFVDVFFLISYSENSRFHSGIVIYKDDQHIEKILELAKKASKDSNSQLIETSDSTDTPTPTLTKHVSFSRNTADYIVTSIGHPIGLKTKYDKSELKPYTINLRKPQDPVLKTKYKRAIKQHDTLDMVEDAMKLGFVSYAEVLGHGIGHIYRGSSTLDIGKAFVGGMGASGQQNWVGLSGDKS